MEPAHTSPDRLITMANQIGTFFLSQRSQDTVQGIADHIRKFWDPRMRKAISAYVSKGGQGLLPEVRRAIEQLAQVEGPAVEANAPT